MVYASSFIVLHSKGSSLQNRIRTFSHALLFDNVQKWVKKWVKGKLGIKKKSLSYCNLGTFVACVKRREREVDIYTKSLKIYIKSYQNYQNIKKLLI